MKVYLASPKFNEAQALVVESIEYILDELNYESYSPFRDSITLKPDASKKERSEVFRSNVQAIDSCDVMIAVVNERDTGTIFEIGYFYSLCVNKGISTPPLIMYVSHDKANISVMLTESAAVLLVGEAQLRNYLNELQVKGVDNIVRDESTFNRVLTH